jgi:hypothetical protein
VNASTSMVRKSRAGLARVGLPILALAAMAAFGLLASACGGSSEQGVAQVDTTETTSTESGAPDDSGSADPTAFSACMRKNGVPKFPDPDSDGVVRLRGAGPGTGIDPESAHFKAAANACRELAPEESAPSPAEQARDRAQLLKFSACMRANGLPKFPDPNPTGGISIGRNRGLDPNSPQFKEAQKACEHLLPGEGTDGSPNPSGETP